MGTGMTSACKIPAFALSRERLKRKEIFPLTPGPSLGGEREPIRSEHSQEEI